MNETQFANALDNITLSTFVLLLFVRPAMFVCRGQHILILFRKQVDQAVTRTSEFQTASLQ